MKAARLKISHKKFKEFKNLYYYFFNENELYFYIKKIYEGGFKIEEIKIKGNVNKNLELFLLLFLFEDFFSVEYIENNIKELREKIYA